MTDGEMLTGRTPAVSVILASYNAAPWLATALDSIVHAALQTSWPVELVVVDDGSTDDTAQMLADYKAACAIPMRVISQQNSGRFLAFYAAAEAASGERILIMGDRMLMQPDAFEYLERVDPTLPEGQVWNGHVPTAPDGPLVSRFWEVPLHIFWGSYLADPKPTEITQANFDRVPKGTGSLLIGRQFFLDACKAVWPKENAALVSDDTKLLRYVVEHRPMRLDPGFGAIYRPRVNVRSFLSHAYTRGTLFVDSYAGTSLVRNILLVGLSILPIVFVIAIVAALVTGAWAFLIVLVALAVLGLLAPAAVAATRKAPARAILSYVTYVVPFGAVFWAGLVRGVVVHRRAFRRPRRGTSNAQ